MQDAISSLLRRYGVVATRMRHVASLGCDVWRITPRPNLAQRGELSLRIYPAQRRELATVRTEVEWLRLLAAQGLHVPRPVPDEAGEYLQRWQPDPATAPRHAVLLTWLPGRMHDQGLTPERLRRVGVMTGQLHAVSERLVASGGVTTKRLAYSLDLLPWAQRRQPGTAALSPGHRALAADAAAQLMGELATFPQDARGYGLIHGDLHPWNILFARDVAGAIDFSDCGWGHAALDLAACLQYLRHPLANNHDHRRGYARLHDSLLAGYAQVRALPPNMARQVDAYIVARMFVTLEWILEDWPTIDHRPWGPGFLRGVQKVFRHYAQA